MRDCKHDKVWSVLGSSYLVCVDCEKTDTTWSFPKGGTVVKRPDYLSLGDEKKFLNCRKLEIILTQYLPGEVEVRYDRRHMTYSVYYRWEDQESRENVTDNVVNRNSEVRTLMENFAKSLSRYLEKDLKPIDKKRVTMDKLVGRDGPHDVNDSYISNFKKNITKETVTGHAVAAMQYGMITPKEARKIILPEWDFDSDKR